MLYKSNKCLENLSVSAVSLSLRSLESFYTNYINNNEENIREHLLQKGYFNLKNKLKLGKKESETRDIYINVYLFNAKAAGLCNQVLSKKYNTSIHVENTKGFFNSATNELVVFISVKSAWSLQKALKDTDILGIIEHEITHAIDNTATGTPLQTQNSLNPYYFLNTCARLGFASKSESAAIIAEMYRSKFIYIEKNPEKAMSLMTQTLNSIEFIIYKLFANTEFNAHQLSELNLLHKANIKNSEKVRKAFFKDLGNEVKKLEGLFKVAKLVTYEDSPTLWIVVGRILHYMGYKVGTKPIEVYRFFATVGLKLLKSYFKKKQKNQVKYIISLREKENIKKELITYIKQRVTRKRRWKNLGASFWFTPTGSKIDFLCRFIIDENEKISLTLNRDEVTIIGSIDTVYKRAIEAFNNNDIHSFEFSVSTIVDLLVQSIERAVNDIPYDALYDITIPQDEESYKASMQTSNRFSDLEFD